MTTAVKPVPPLESGDVLSAEQFWRIYSERDDIHRAELIGGTVYVSPPVANMHGRPHSLLSGWLMAHAMPRGLYTADNLTVVLAEDVRVQPDLLMLADKDSTATLGDDGYLYGAPDLAVEIAASSASYDLHTKKDAYEAAGVREYLVWRTYDRAVDWFRLVDGTYERLEPVQGAIASALFPGLVLDVEALLRGDYATVFRRVAGGGPGAQPPAS